MDQESQRQLDAIWPRLSSKILPLITREQTTLSVKDWMSLYSDVYNYFMFQATDDGSVNGIYLFYNLLSSMLQSAVSTLAKKIEGLFDGELLLGYKQEWIQFTTTMSILQHIFTSLNKEIEDTCPGELRVFELSLMTWRRELLMPMKDKLLNAGVEIIRQERSGQLADSSLLSTLSHSFAVLSSEHLKSTDIYKLHFQKEFFEETERYYTSERCDFMLNTNYDIPAFLMKSDIHLNAEIQRAKLYLRENSRTAYISLCDRVLIAQHKEVIMTEFVRLIEEKKMEDLARMYRLFSRIHEGLAGMRVSFGNYVQRVGLQAIATLSPALQTDPKAYVETLITVYKDNEQLVDGPFNGDGTFHVTLTKACRVVINSNIVCKQHKAIPKSAEMVAKYANIVMKKNYKPPSDDDLDALLHDITIIFSLLDDKDVFISIYAKSLALRFIHQLYASEDQEAAFISKLKNTGGVESVSKLQRMFTDFTQSKAFSTKFQNYCEAIPPHLLPKVDCDVRVLSFNAWPLPPPSPTFILPPVLQECVQLFLRFYSEMHGGRKLTWLHQYSKVEMSAQFTTNNKKYIFLCFDNYLASVLLLFNDSNEISFEDMKVATQLEASLLTATVCTLMKANIIVSKDLPENPSKVPNLVIEPHALFALNANYKSAKTKVSIRTEAEKALTSALRPGRDPEWEEDRKIKIQAAVVRIMKMRKEMRHTQLVSEVIQQLKALFNPSVTLIKTCIHILIEKEYLCRVENKPDCYQYVA